MAGHSKGRFVWQPTCKWQLRIILAARRRMKRLHYQGPWLHQLACWHKQAKNPVNCLEHLLSLTTWSTLTHTQRDIIPCTNSKSREIQSFIWCDSNKLPWILLCTEHRQLNIHLHKNDTHTKWTPVGTQGLCHKAVLKSLEIALTDFPFAKQKVYTMWLTGSQAL